MTICIVGNKRPDQDVSAQVDAADTVIRVSKMDHLDTGLIGRRTDALYLEPNYVWWHYSAQVRRTEMLRDIPAIYIRASWWRRVGDDLLDGGIVRRDQVQVIPADVESGLPGCTTLAMAVYDVHRRLPDARILLAGADVGVERHRVFWAHVAGGEIEFMDGLIKDGVLEVI